MAIKNEAELNSLMEKLVGEALDKATVRILENLKLQIKKDVFTTKNDWYERTGQFEEAWEWTKIKSIGKTIVTEMFYNSSKVKHDGKWVHGNPKQSSVENLADILNLAYNGYTSGYTSSLMFGQRMFSHFRRPYWKNFIEKMFNENELNRILAEEFKKVGFLKR